MSQIEDRTFSITFRDGRRPQVLACMTDADAVVDAMTEADHGVARVEYRNGGASELWSIRAWLSLRKRMLGREVAAS